MQNHADREAACAGGTAVEGMMDDLISRQAAIEAADDMVEPQESEDKE